MRILVCAQEPPTPAVNGFRVHLAPLLRELRRRHDVRVVAIRTPDAEPDETMRLVDPAPGGRSRMSALASRRPLDADAAAGALLAAVTDELAAFRPDVVHVTPGRLAGLAASLGDVPRVLGALDAWHLNVRARARLRPAPLRVAATAYEVIVRRFERTEYRRFGAIVVVSEQDAAALRNLDPELRVVVIPNGVDEQDFQHDGSQRAPGRIAFTGVMSYAPNVTAAQRLATKILPRVRSRLPGAHLVLVGRSPDARVSALADLDGVTVTGEVPSLRPALSQASVFCCPMSSGTGIKNKLLEAMANGLPCVATRLATQGLEVVDGRHVLLAEGDDEIAAHITRLIENTSLAAELGEAARTYVSGHHSWSSAAQRWERVYEDAMTSPLPA